ncbi:MULTISPECIES: metallophosphoesterase [Haloferax]|uniref:Phosphoesterase n=1 Tax=Haloferax marinum TaxID=2666143 RepID=A0A6A8GC22_9EURY|nr:MULTISPECIES: metallophosphoesterase family protein [Haloferax]KAB1190766.1 metallophosphoesterase family protein [Haloferax sp. CBA1150]MRW98305.1 YfcE family phosphodiesterase [Haloferax marinum]
MRIALLSDVHGNLPALEAVLDDLPAVDAVVCAGDVVGYNPWPSECVERIRAVSDVVVRGNHDAAVETPSTFEANQMAKAGIEFAAENLSAEQRTWLRELPESETFADDSFLLVHSHPTIRGKYVFPSEFPTLRRHLDDYRGIVVGHTHIQHSALIDGRLILNPGSVGQPRDSDARAAYAVLDTEAHDVDCRRVEYDINRVIDKVEDVGLPAKIGTRLLDGS